MRRCTYPSYDLGAIDGSSDRPRRWLLFMTAYCESGLRLPIMTILVILKSKYHELILRTESRLHMRNVSALPLMIFLGLGQQLTKKVPYSTL